MVFFQAEDGIRDIGVTGVQTCALPISKEFTEQLILGQITLQTLEAAGATVNDQIGLAGTVAARKALESGEIDMYWEYTGTGWRSEEHTSELQSRQYLVCRLLLEKKKSVRDDQQDKFLKDR